MINAHQWKYFLESRANPFDVEEISHSFDSTEIRIWHEYENDSHPVGFFASRHLDVLTDPVLVDFRARQLVNVLNGAALLLDYPATLFLNGLYKIKGGATEGPIYIEKTLSAKPGSRDSLSDFERTLHTSFNTEVNSMKLSKLILLAKSNPDVSTVFRQLSEYPLEWVTMYRIFEKVQLNLGKGRVNEIVDNKELSRFKRTAQDPVLLGDLARHGAYNNDTEPKPMGENEGRVFVMNLCKKWIEGIVP